MTCSMSSETPARWERLIEKETQKAIEALGAFEDSDFLKELSMKLAIREC